MLVVDHRLPTPDRDAGSMRLWATIESLLELGCRVVMLPDDQAARQPAASELQGMGVEVLVGPLDVAAKIGQLGDRLDLAILCRPYVAPRYLHLIRRLAPRARIAYDTVDLHFLREERRIGHEGGGDLAPAASFKELELGIMRACDLTFVAGPYEQEMLRDLVPGAEIDVLSFVHAAREDVPGPGRRSGLLFVGGFEHDPNVDAALHLGHDIMPRVRSELGGGGRLSIVGPNPPAEVRALAAPDIEVKGWVQDLDPVIDEAMVSVAPLRYGAGIKGKVTLSLASGLPVVTSSIGAEGLSARDGRDLMVADDADSFARKVVDLHRDPELWSELSRSGRRLAERVTSRETQLAALRAALR